MDRFQKINKNNILQILTLSAAGDFSTAIKDRKDAPKTAAPRMFAAFGRVPMKWAFYVDPRPKTVDAKLLAVFGAEAPLRSLSGGQSPSSNLRDARKRPSSPS